MNLSAREAAFLAVLASLKNTSFVADFLLQWQREFHPSDLDFRFAQEIANGTVRMTSALDSIARQLNSSGRLSLKPKEKALLRTALYQHYYMSKVPLFALVDEAVKLSKKHCHPTFTAFLNRLLRRIEETAVHLPDDDRAESLALSFSYPEEYIRLLLEEQGLSLTREILAAGNIPPPVMLRVRPEANLTKFQDPAFEWISHSHPSVVALKEGQKVPLVAEWRDCYIQNLTPAKLLDNLSTHWQGPPPKTILDLCSAPGGKLLAAHDLFPLAHLFANDVSEEKLNLVKVNAHKYNLDVTYFCQKGEEFVTAQKFDLVIVDAPCSNTGVLNKRSEARWRLTPESIQAHVNLQQKLLKRALELINPGGEVWYLTCSILKSENGELLRSLGLPIKFEETVFPNLQGIDGGYGSSVVYP